MAKVDFFCYREPDKSSLFFMFPLDAGTTQKIKENLLGGDGEFAGFLSGSSQHPPQSAHCLRKCFSAAGDFSASLRARLWEVVVPSVVHRPAASAPPEGLGLQALSPLL